MRREFATKPLIVTAVLRSVKKRTSLVGAKITFRLLLRQWLALKSCGSIVAEGVVSDFSEGMFSGREKEKGWHSRRLQPRTPPLNQD
jgi:hypothetical protein